MEALAKISWLTLSTGAPGAFAGNCFVPVPHRSVSIRSPPLPGDVGILLTHRGALFSCS